MTIVELIGKAVEAGNVDQLPVLERIHAAELERIERERKLKAKIAFCEAMLSFKSQVLTVAKGSSAEIMKNGKKVGEYRYPSIDQMVSVAVPGLSKVGIVHAWNTRTESGRVLVKCTLVHVSTGHEAVASVELPMDTSGAKNDAQATCSAITYGERYSFMAVTGLAAGGVDNDATTVKSEDEVSRHSEALPDKIDGNQIAYLNGLAKKAGVSDEVIRESCHISALEDLDHKGFERLKRKLLATLKKNGTSP